MFSRNLRFASKAVRRITAIFDDPRATIFFVVVVILSLYLLFPLP